MSIQKRRLVFDPMAGHSFWHWLQGWDILETSIIILSVKLDFSAKPTCGKNWICVRIMSTPIQWTEGNPSLNFKPKKVLVQKNYSKSVGSWAIAMVVQGDVIVTDAITAAATGESRDLGFANISIFTIALVDSNWVV